MPLTAAILSLMNPKYVKSINETNYFLEDSEAAPLTFKAIAYFRSKIEEQKLDIFAGKAPLNEPFRVEPKLTPDLPNLGTLKQGTIMSILVLGYYDITLTDFKTEKRSDGSLHWSAQINIIDKMGWEIEKYSPETWQAFYRQNGPGSLAFTWTYRARPNDRETLVKDMDTITYSLCGPSREFSRGAYSIQGELKGNP